MSEWISVEERLPASGVEVLAFGYVHKKPGWGLQGGLKPKEEAGKDPESKFQTTGLFDNNGRFQSGKMCGVTITHWQTLPEPPKE